MDGYDENGDPLVQGTIQSVAISVNTLAGADISARLEKAMSDEILLANSEGISTSEENSWKLRERMKMAHDREIGRIIQEAQDAQDAAKAAQLEQDLRQLEIVAQTDPDLQ